MARQLLNIQFKPDLLHLRLHGRSVSVCSVVYVPGHEPLTTVADLRAVGLRVPGDHYAETRWPEFACLCGLEATAVMDANGLSYFEDLKTGDLVVFPLSAESWDEP